MSVAYNEDFIIVRKIIGTTFIVTYMDNAAENESIVAAPSS
jgi:hypothetical protein